VLKLIPSRFYLRLGREIAGAAAILILSVYCEPIQIEAVHADHGAGAVFADGLL
jgi:hypothetical protein